MCTSDDRAVSFPYQCLSLLVWFLLSQVCIWIQEDSGEHWLDRGEQHRRRRLCEQPEHWSGTRILHRTQPERSESCHGYGGKFTIKFIPRDLGFSKSEPPRVWIWEWGPWNCETGRREKLDWGMPCFHNFKTKCRRFGGMAKKRWESRVNSGIINVTKAVWISPIVLSKLHSHVASDSKVNSILQKQRQKGSKASAASSEEALSQATISYYGSKTTALKSHSSYVMDSKALHKLICPSMKRSQGKKFNDLTLPSAPSSTPSSPSTISVDTETPPEGCRCFCPSIFRSLNAGKKEHYQKMQAQLPMVNTNQHHQVRVLLCGNKPTPQCHLQESIHF